MTVKPAKKGGRPKLLLDETERRALRLAQDRVRKAKTTEARERAENDAEAIRKLAHLRTELAAQAANCDAERAREEAWKQRKRAPDIKIYRALWREDKVVARLIAERWTAITATGDYSRALDGTLDIRKAKLGLKTPRAWLPSGRSWQAKPRCFEFIRLKSYRKRKLSRIRRAFEGTPADKSRGRRYFTGQTQGAALLALAASLAEWWSQRLRRYLKRRPARHELVEYCPKNRTRQLKARTQRRLLTSDQRVEHERRKAEATEKLPAPVDPHQFYRRLRLQDIAARPLPKSTDRLAAASEGLEIVSASRGPTDFELIVESWLPTRVEPQHKRVKLYHPPAARKNPTTGHRLTRKLGRKTGEMPSGTEPVPLHIRAKEAWIKYAQAWTEANRREKQNAIKEAEHTTQQGELDEAA